MLREFRWRRGLLRLWAVATLLWIVGTLWSVVVPHYFAAPLTPSATEIQRVLQNQLDCLGYDDVNNTDKPWLHGKCAVKPPGQDLRLDITIQIANEGSLTINLGDGEHIEGVSPNVSAKELADKLHRQFAEDDAKMLYEPVGRDAALVLAPPFAMLLLGFASAWVLRGFSRHKQDVAGVGKRP